MTEAVSAPETQSISSICQTVSVIFVQLLQASFYGATKRSQIENKDFHTLLCFYILIQAGVGKNCSVTIIWPLTTWLSCVRVQTFLALVHLCVHLSIDTRRLGMSGMQICNASISVFLLALECQSDAILGAISFNRAGFIMYGQSRRSFRSL